MTVPAYEYNEAYIHNDPMEFFPLISLIRF